MYYIEYLWEKMVMVTNHPNNGQQFNSNYKNSNFYEHRTTLQYTNPNRIQLNNLQSNYPNNGLNILIQINFL